MANRLLELPTRLDLHYGSAAAGLRAPQPRPGRHLLRILRGRAAGFQTCRIADFPIGGSTVCRARLFDVPPAGWETRETADLEVCGTKKAAPPRRLQLKLMDASKVQAPGATSGCAHFTSDCFFRDAGIALL